jgi:hypothetical protein
MVHLLVPELEQRLALESVALLVAVMVHKWRGKEWERWKGVMWAERLGQW